MFFLCLSVLLLCHSVLGLPTPSDVSTYNDSDLRKLGIFKNNNYFQGSEQIFNLVNIFINGTNVTCNNGTNQTVKIPDNYILIPKIGAFKLHTAPKKWNEARKNCVAEGSHLAVIKSAAEEAFVQKLLAENAIESVWLGIHEQFQKDDWVTTQDQALNTLGYVKWREGEPNNFNGIEHCVSYFKDGMEDSACDLVFAYLCKIDV